MKAWGAQILARIRMPFDQLGRESRAGESALHERGTATAHRSVSSGGSLAFSSGNDGCADGIEGLWTAPFLQKSKVNKRVLIVWKSKHNIMNFRRNNM